MASSRYHYQPPLGGEGPNLGAAGGIKGLGGSLKRRARLEAARKRKGGPFKRKTTERPLKRLAKAEKRIARGSLLPRVGKAARRWGNRAFPVLLAAEIATHPQGVKAGAKQMVVDQATGIKQDFTDIGGALIEGGKAVGEFGKNKRLERAIFEKWGTPERARRTRAKNIAKGFRR
jgi:hypothetical protein